MKSKIDYDGFGPMHKTLEIHEFEEVALEHLHEKQIFDLLAWHNNIVDAK